MAARLYIGTSGWSYPTGEGTWQSVFYPPGIKNELEYYSQYFNTVEVNSSFYRPPDPRVAASWARRTPVGFLFTVKLWQKFTHPRMYETATGEAAAVSLKDVDSFKASLEPLAGQAKLGAVLVQFPPSLVNSDRGRQMLGAVLRHFGEYPLAVELRHKSWSDDPATANLLRERNAAWVTIDEPKFAFSIATELPPTANLAYFRFHGRNAETWWSGDSETRYKYLYSTEEITQLAESVKQAGKHAGITFAFFNNHWRAYAPKNANDLKRALQLAFTDFPSPGFSY